MYFHTFYALIFATYCFDGLELNIFGAFFTALLPVYINFLTLRRSSLEPGKQSAKPRNLLKNVNLKLIVIINWTPDVIIQQILNADGKVIQIGIDNKGKILKNFENLRNCELLEAEVLELTILRKEKRPPIRGSIPVGSGALKSLNQNIPSVRIAGYILKL